MKLNMDKVAYMVGKWTPIIGAALYCVYMAANLMR